MKLSAAAINSGKTWDSAANPDLDIRNIILNTANTTGFYAQNVAYGDAAFLKRATSYESQLTAGSLARASVYNEEQLATALGVSSTLINMERYQNTATAKQEIVAAKWRAVERPALATLRRVILQCYYRDDRVVRALGREARPPFPKGNVLEQGDWSLLDPVRARPKMWRDVVGG